MGGRGRVDGRAAGSDELCETSEVVSVPPPSIVNSDDSAVAVEAMEMRARAVLTPKSSSSSNEDAVDTVSVFGMSFRCRVSGVCGTKRGGRGSDDAAQSGGEGSVHGEGPLDDAPLSGTADVPGRSSSAARADR